MALVEEVLTIIRDVPEEWRDEFAKLVQGGSPSEDFIRIYDESPTLQSCADKVLRLLDGDFMQQAFAVSATHKVGR